MVDELGMQNFFDHTYQELILPEIIRRKNEGRLNDNFRISQCLIRLPQTGNPVVEFNNEVGWAVRNPELAAGMVMAAGQEIYLHEIVKLGRVLPPTVDDKRVAFVYLYWSGATCNIIFDFKPNWPDFDPEEDTFEIGEHIAHHLRLMLIEMTLKSSQNVQSQLRQIGIWPVVSLLPYPISKIVERVGAGQLDEAREILVAHCNSDFIEQRLVATWKPIKVFTDRSENFQEALFAHRHGKYRATIYTLVPQIEGVITDWLYEILGEGIVKFRPESKIQQFRQMSAQMPQLETM